MKNLSMKTDQEETRMLELAVKDNKTIIISLACV